jgi:hypothetical protein
MSVKGSPQEKIDIIREQAIIQLKSMMVDARLPGKLIRMVVSQHNDDNYLVRTRVAAQECPGGQKFEMDITFGMRVRLLPAKEA